MTSNQNYLQWPENGRIDQSRLTRLLGYRLTQAELQLRRMFFEVMAPFELRPVDFSLLLLVDANPGINLRQVGEILRVAAPNMGSVVTRLAKRGLLRQQRGLQDRRMQHLRMTAAGGTLLAEAEAALLKMEKRMVSQLGRDGRRQLLQLLDVLTRD